MNDKVIKKLIKLYLEDNNFEIIEQIVDGYDQVGVGHLGTTEAWNIVPDMNSVNPAKDKIKEVLNEK